MRKATVEPSQKLGSTGQVTVKIAKGKADKTGDNWQWQCWPKLIEAKDDDEQQVVTDDLPMDASSEKRGSRLVWPTEVGSRHSKLEREGPLKPRLVFAGQKCGTTPQPTRANIPGASLGLNDPPSECADKCITYMGRRSAGVDGGPAWASPEARCKFFEMASDHDATTTNRLCAWNWGTCGETVVDGNVDVYENAHVTVRRRAEWSVDSCC
jgi:hypothetical protein